MPLLALRTPVTLCRYVMPLRYWVDVGGCHVDVCGVNAKRYPITLPHVIAETLRTPLRTPFNLNQSHAFISVTLYRSVMQLCRCVMPLRYAVTLCRYVSPL